MAIQTIKVISLSAFADEVMRLRDRWIMENVKDAKKSGDEIPERVQAWFRGQANARWKLRPKLHRLKRADENEIRAEFKLRGSQLIGDLPIPKDNREWYFLMQHYGAPTRLLDWTDGALIALYFAVKPQARFRNSAVWMLDPEWLNDKVLPKLDEDSYVTGVMLPDWTEADPWFPEPFSQPLLVPYPVAIDPPHVARRVSSQRSRFTIHGRSRSGLEVVVNRMTKPRLIKFIIPNTAHTVILQDLSTCGITETSVYPDLEGLSKELLTKWAG
jgi:FRG domain